MDPEADEAAMAQLMGFSAFGAQDRPPKKRRRDGFYDAASNRNPWQRLEEAFGLRPLGAWPSRNHQQPAAAPDAP